MFARLPTFLDTFLSRTRVYKETEDSDDDEYEEDDDNSEKGFDDEINPFERAAWEAEQDEIRKAYETLGLDYDDIEKAKHQDGDMHPNGKWVWRQSANGGKGDWRVAKPGGSKATAGGSSAASKTTSNKVISGKQFADYVESDAFMDNEEAVNKLNDYINKHHISLDNGKTQAEDFDKLYASSG